jgi:hypothetical protein
MNEDGTYRRVVQLAVPLACECGRSRTLWVQTAGKLDVCFECGVEAKIVNHRMIDIQERIATVKI